MRRLFAICVLMFAPPGQAWAADSADQQARAMFAADWQWRMQNNPEFATTVGDNRYDATLSDTTLAASRAATAHERTMLEQARAIERERLTGQTQLSYDLFVEQKERALKAAAFYPYRLQPLTAQDGIHLTFPRLVAQMPFATEADYRNYLSRIDALPAHVDGLIEQMREALRSGWSTPKPALRALPAMLRQLRESLAAGTLSLPFRAIPGAIAKPVRDELAAAGPAALRTRAAPALQKLEDFVRIEYLPAARDTIAASSLPGGADYYQFAIADNTGTDMSAAAIHKLGLKEVARIGAEMRMAIARTGFRGTFRQFAAFANSDPRLFYSTPEQLLARYRKLVARASAGLPRLFETRPAEPLGVKAAQEAGADFQGAAYYEAAVDGQPAALVINTARLATRALWETETLALHEGVPGHHLQVARAHELAELPEFRRFGWYPAFGEGWALYAESLGPELGFFAEPFSAFGHLNADLLRAARLVADTGIHALGWSRQQAIDYLAATTANPASDNEIEVDRYIAAPGHALAYKIGQLRIKALRDKAQAALGPKFDLRRFHGAVLDNGALPLTILEQQVERWIRASAREGVAMPKTAPAG
ncbi:DUF885 domain-containing protein [Massilia eurypsychrophila]|uniref:DUF885 domain-containing protein n=2 Tax=Massilia eurypsychrophila TaxID=1485217 RepID=A0A2G8TLM1_9BURK|nr:DUF885 domain-containing protein [Massilia eurypsychrophila]